MAYLSEDNGNNNKYLYNGKEYEDDHNLFWYHYGVRYYDPQLCRWLQIDPVDEFHSPYAYGPNNPINGIDPDGTRWVMADDGNTIWINLPGVVVHGDGTMDNLTWADYERPDNLSTFDLAYEWYFDHGLRNSILSNGKSGITFDSALDIIGTTTDHSGLALDIYSLLKLSKKARVFGTVANLISTSSDISLMLTSNNKYTRMEKTFDTIMGLVGFAPPYISVSSWLGYQNGKYLGNKINNINTYKFPNNWFESGDCWIFHNRYLKN